MWTLRQKWHATNFHSQLVHCGVDCPGLQCSEGSQCSARHSFSQKLPVILPQSTHGRMRLSGVPTLVTESVKRPVFPCSLSSAVKGRLPPAEPSEADAAIDKLEVEKLLSPCSSLQIT
jgi:hypothetical protein